MLNQTARNFSSMVLPMLPPITPQARNLSHHPYRPAPEPVQAGKQPAGKHVDSRETMLDVTQVALDVVGIFEPTPVADGANTLISLGRGDWMGAGLSLAGVFPYVGDAAKLGKLGKWAETASNAVELALKNNEFAKAAGPHLKKIADAIDHAPKGMFDKLPADAQQKLLEMRATLGRLPGAAAEGPAGSLAHKGNAWSEYSASGGNWNYERWSKTYEGNMTRATDAHKAADALQAERGWGTRESTTRVNMPDGQSYSRRFDIGDNAAQRGIEHKSGYQYLSQENNWELQRDAELVKRGWDVEWVLDGTASQPLLDALKAAGIKATVR